MKTHAILTICLCALAAVVAGHTQASGGFPPEAMIGEWKGEGDIIVAWCEKNCLPVHLVIRPDGSVEGTVGDATLRDGRVKRNNRILIWLGNSQYIVNGKLYGPIVADENIERESVKLLLDVVGEGLEGDIRTSGSKAGGKRSMAMTIHYLRLARVEGEMPR